MAITKVTEGVRTLGTGEVTAANLAADATSGVTANQDDIALLGFKVAANGSLARYNLVDQSIDAFEDASGVDASGSTNEVRNASNYYYGEVFPSISGNYDDSGVDGDYSWYKWTTVRSDGSYTTDTAQDYEYLVVAGGGAGCGGGINYVRGGGGGAGGYRTATGFAVAATTISSITIGAAGAGNDDYETQGGEGGDSVFSTITSNGGGGGGAYSQGGADGGSGGAGGTRSGLVGPGGSGNTPSTSPVQGYDGGDGTQYSSGSGTSGGGGGGSSAVGANASSGDAGDGGAGTSSSIDGSATLRAGGGGGGGGTSAGSGGSGGGGAGFTGNGAGTDATINTGSGGGGAAAVSAANYSGGDGGSGIVIIRRLTSANLEGADITLISNAQTAESAPTNGDLVMTISNGAGTTTPNTDIKAYIARDGSDYTTAVTLVDQGDTGGHTILTANGVDLSEETSGTSMRWKITTHNQSASKQTRIQAVSLGWS